MTTRLSSDWRLLVFGFLMMFWSSPGQTYLISLYGGEIRNTFSLSHGDFGAIYSMGTLASAAVMVWSGRFIDRFDLRKFSLALVFALAIACWWMSIISGLAGLVFGIFLLRQTGQGLMSHAASTTMVRYFDSARGKATAVASIGFATAEACLPAVTIGLIAALGWRSAWQTTAIILLAIMLPAIFLLLRGHTQRHQIYLSQLAKSANTADSSTVAQSWNRAQVLRDYRFYMAMPAFLSPSFFFTGFFFHQVHLVNAKGWELSWWGESFIVYAGASLLATLVSGPMVDRFGATRQLPLFPIPLACALSILAFSSSTVAGICFLAFTGFTTGWIATVMGPFWAENYGLRYLGANKALGSALVVFSSALSPFILGWLIDIGITLEFIAMGSAIYIVFVCLLASLSYRK